MPCLPFLMHPKMMEGSGSKGEGKEGMFKKNLPNANSQ